MCIHEYVLVTDEGEMRCRECGLILDYGDDEERIDYDDEYDDDENS